MFANQCRQLLFGFVFVLMGGVATGAEPVAKSWNGVAIGGHDPHAYHELSKDPQSAAVEGKKAFVVEFKGAKWRFINEDSAEKFKADPQRYAPMYNGHCANALSLGEGLIRTDGTHWEIFGDNLYLFYAARGRDRWLDGGWESYKADADAAWKALGQ